LLVDADARVLPLSPRTVSDVVRRAQLGDVEAFEALYRTHVGRVHALCLRMCGDRAQAEELTQDAFIVLWEKLPLFRGESAFESWLHRLVCNCVLQQMRSDKRRIARVEPMSEPPERSSGGSARPDARIDLETAIAALPPGARMVFVLHDVEGYRHEEIARLTGRAAGTLRAQLHRARTLLMEALS
jgi:RNA polymerase sigma-70 factor (ECF subfamily)